MYLFIALYRKNVRVQCLICFGVGAGATPFSRPVAGAGSGCVLRGQCHEMEVEIMPESAW
jgi:hypothetical protein